MLDTLSILTRAHRSCCIRCLTWRPCTSAPSPTDTVPAAQTRIQTGLRRRPLELRATRCWSPWPACSRACLARQTHASKSWRPGARVAPCRLPSCRPSPPATWRRSAASDPTRRSCSRWNTRWRRSWARSRRFPAACTRRWHRGPSSPTSKTNCSGWRSRRT